MTVINMDMLNFFNLNNESKTIIRDYCYLSLTNNQLNVNEQRPNTVTTGRLSLNHQNQMQQQQQQQRNEQKNALIKQQHKRRSRSQSRNTRMFSTVHKDNQLSISIAINDQPDLQPKQSQKNLFESFMVNNNLNFLKLIKFDEKSHLNPANIQMYLDKLCVHKKHLKLDNLKTLNLSNNKIVNFKICLSLLADKPKEAVPQQPIDSDDSDTDSDQNPTKKQVDDDKKILKVFYPNLAHLDLSTNLIKSLNGTFGLLENLSYLNVSSNSQLSTISPKLCLLTKLWNFDLKNCLNLSDTVLNGMVTKQRVKTSEILAYLKSIHENSKPYVKLKLMVLGVQGQYIVRYLRLLLSYFALFIMQMHFCQCRYFMFQGIGKTSLLNKLKEETNPGLFQQAQQQQRFRFSNDKRPIAHTTVNLGLNINEWVYDKPSKPAQRTTSTQYVIVQQQNQAAKSFGPITFRTHDFTGQKEYYSTHQYFLSKRCVYLICWKLTDEEKGINEIHTWLLNIQTRAPGSPCILVGTHYDQLYKLKNYKEISNFLQRIIYERFIKPNENEICAYPPIWASIEVSSKTGTHHQFFDFIQ
jgi:GTPase SAR1 family protein